MTEISPREVGLALVGLTQRLRRELRRAVGTVSDREGTTDGERELLRHVRAHPGSRIGEAAAGLGLAANTVSTMVHRLEREGWLRRQPDAEDGRAQRLTLTHRAALRTSAWHDARVAVISAALESMHPRDVDQLRRALPLFEEIVLRLGTIGHTRGTDA